MSVYVSALVWRRSTHKGSNLLVLLALADNAKDSGIAWPGLQYLADKTRLSRRGVQYALSGLLDSGELTCLRKGAGKQTSVFRVEVQRLRDQPERIGADDDGEWRNPASPMTQPVAPKPSEPSSNRQTPKAPEPIGFSDWLARHAQLTGHRVPAEGSKVRARYARRFADLVGAGYTPADFDLASRGVHSQDWWREKGKDTVEYVLRDAHFAEFIAVGRDAAPTDPRGGKYGHLVCN